ncbi:MAG: uroporphyrinogen decarboxylase, partial [Spirochaetaceae bacterium]|nr:uroporphyrinogen decarboxylase [Spirochaetaceae bacterium]
PPLVAACRRQPVERVPIWLMRQAGRYLPEYRELRSRYGMLDILGSAELAARVTLQPLRRFDFDGAIIFADILPPLTGLGLDLSFGNGTSPRIHNPVRGADDVAALREADPRRDLAATMRAMRMVRAELPPEVALIGFSGAPFTLATYAIEGGTSRQFTLTKRMMFEQPAAWRALMERLTRLVIDYLAAQADAGAQVLQIFDSWAGVLSSADYRAHVLPFVRRVCADLQPAGVPLIYFSTGTGTLLDLLAELPCDVLSVDWRVDLAAVRRLLPARMALQGNLEPALLFAPEQVLEPRARAVLAAGASAPGYIFNLGHGILPQTPPEAVARLVDLVHGHTAAAGSAPPGAAS